MYDDTVLFHTPPSLCWKSMRKVFNSLKKNAVQIIKEYTICNTDFINCCRFLYEDNSRAHKYYRQCIQQAKEDSAPRQQPLVKQERDYPSVKTEQRDPPYVKQESRDSPYMKKEFSEMSYGKQASFRDSPQIKMEPRDTFVKSEVASMKVEPRDPYIKSESACFKMEPMDPYMKSEESSSNGNGPLKIGLLQSKGKMQFVKSESVFKSDAADDADTEEVDGG